MGLRVDLLRDAEFAIRVVRLALELGLVDLSITMDEEGFVVLVRPPTGTFAAEPLAAMSKLTEAINSRSLFERATANSAG
jgi:hypothetical protein